MTSIVLSPREVALVHSWMRAYRGELWTWCPLVAAEWPIGDPLHNELLWTIAGSAAHRGDPCAAALRLRVEAALGPERVDALYAQMLGRVEARLVDAAQAQDTEGLRETIERDLADRDARFAAAERGGFAMPAASGARS